jgi:NADH-quinone oxidoreductase subunit K
LLTYYLLLAAALFAIGFTIVIVKKNAIMILMGVELMLNAVNVNFIAFSYYDPQKLQGQIFALFVLMVAASEAAVGLAIVLKLYSHFKTAELGAANTLKG